MSVNVKKRTRRKVFLEGLSLAVPISAAVFFSGEFIVDWSPHINVYFASLTALTLAAFWIWHRNNYPANIAPPAPKQEPEARPNDDGGWWDWFTILLFVVSFIAVVVAGIVGRFLLSLLVIFLFGVGYSGSDLGDVARATLATLGVAFVLEFAIVIPLCKLWNLAIDEEPRSREDFCPTPSDSPRD